MKKKQARSRPKLSRTVAANKLLWAVGDWVNANGGSAVVAGDIGLMDAPNLRDVLTGPDPLTFYVCVKVTGKRPEKA